MKRVIRKQAGASASDNEMRPEYDFKNINGGVRGKYAQAYRAGHAVKIRRSDGTTVIQQFRLEDGTVVLDPDVRKYFPDSQAVNQALRGLIALLPKKHSAK